MEERIDAIVPLVLEDWPSTTWPLVKSLSDLTFRYPFWLSHLSTTPVAFGSSNEISFSSSTKLVVVNVDLKIGKWWLGIILPADLVTLNVPGFSPAAR